MNEMTAPSPRYPLDGIRVLAVEGFIAAPLCTMWLGDLGAEVIKIEAPGKGDPRRSFIPMMQNEHGEKISGGFMAYNRNKKSLTVDLKSSEGVGVFKELVKKSDVVVENLKPGTMERLGLDYPVLRELNPGLIYVALSGFGRMESLKGPYSDWPAFDAVIQAMAGIMHRVGEADGPPLLGVAGSADRISALTAGYAVLLALFMRERTGRGQLVDVAMYDANLLLNETAMYMYSLTGTVLTRGKEELYAPVGGFKTRDGWVGLIITNEDMWARLCRAMDRVDLIEHPLCKGTKARAANYASFVKPIVDEWMVNRTQHEVVEALLAEECPVGIVQTSEDLYRCPQVEARHMLVEVDDPVAGKRKFVNNPFRFSDTPEKPAVRPPRLGEHNREILSEVLGYNDVEIERLRQAGVL